MILQYYGKVGDIDAMLYRKIEKTIEEHLRSGSQKILLVDGARQVEKHILSVILAGVYLKISSK